MTHAVGTTQQQETGAEKVDFAMSENAAYIQVVIHPHTKMAAQQ